MVESVVLGIVLEGAKCGLGFVDVVTDDFGGYPTKHGCILFDALTTSHPSLS